MARSNNFSAAQVRQYERDGIAYPLSVMSLDEAQRFRSAFEELEVYLDRKLEYVAMTHLYFRWAFELATWPKTLNLVEQILGPEVLIQGSLILCKHANDPSFVAWHQDVNYSSQPSSPTVNAWIALSDSTRTSGCMRVIPGSHREGVLPHSEAPVENNILRSSAAADDARALDIELRAGEMSLHQADLVHGSLPNQSDDRRIGFIVRFVTPQFQNSMNPVVRARGAKACQNLTLWPGPPGGDLDYNLGAWREYVTKRNLFR
jgi:hypothetical protein